MLGNIIIFKFFNDFYFFIGFVLFCFDFIYIIKDKVLRIENLFYFFMLVFYLLRCKDDFLEFVLFFLFIYLVLYNYSKVVFVRLRELISIYWCFFFIVLSMGLGRVVIVIFFILIMKIISILL